MDQADLEYESQLPSVYNLLGKPKPEEGDDIPTPPEDGDKGDAESDEDEDESMQRFDTFSNPKKEFERQNAQLDKRIKELEKAVSSGKMSADDAEAEMGKLKEQYTAAKKALKQEGVTAKQIREIFTPKEEPKPDGDINPMPTDEVKGTEEQEEQYQTPYEASNTPEARIAAARKQLEADSKAVDKRKDLTAGQKDIMKKRLSDRYKKHERLLREGKSESEIEAEARAIKDRIKTTSRGKPIHGSEHITQYRGRERTNVEPMPKELVESVTETLLKPEWEGFEIDSDEKGNPLWVKGQYGFVRNPDTGVFGKITPDGKIVKLVDPDNPKYKGPDAPETRKAYKEWKRLASQHGVESAKASEAFKEFNYCRAGVPTYDEFPSNRVIVSNAIADVLEQFATD